MKLAEKKDCCGCGACVNACHFNALRMKKDKYGYLYPYYDEEKCVNCDACTRSCPVINHEENSEDICYYVGHIADEKELRKTASGGAATAIACSFLDVFSGYIVGCEYEPDKYSCRHIIISDKTEIGRFSGTKYIQSDKGSIYEKVLKLVLDKKKILYFGTPCEIAAIKTFLEAHGAGLDNLYTCDLICHGPISDQIQREFINNCEKKVGSKCTGINPKDKQKANWLDRSLLLYFENGKSIQVPFYQSALGDAFVNMYRQSCGNCSFKKGRLLSDVTLGDFWGCNIHDQIYQNGGVSLLIIHTKKGEELVQNMKAAAEFNMKEVPASYALKDNPLYVNRASSAQREKFIRAYDKAGIQYASDKCLNLKGKIKRKLNERTI